jgi:ribonuclease-3
MFKFKDPNLKKQSLVHRSYLNENKKDVFEHNERLEFLGDAVLELVITDLLFKKYPNKAEGEMTSFRAALVNAVTLSGIADKLKINDYLLLSKGEAKDTGRARQFILANTIEALIGAIYLDQGYDIAKSFIEKYIWILVDEIVANSAWLDAKSHFQEKAQEIVGVTPSYEVLKEAGPDHDKRFTVGVFLGKEKVADGEGKSKQDAEQDAAGNGLKAKNWG